ncbi:MAG: hypothetical protein JO182_00465 [Acidobacteriaceae bacterium]|nr:hypothetical protein [Acidobacteriaceae bacterium]
MTPLTCKLEGDTENQSFGEFASSIQTGVDNNRDRIRDLDLARRLLMFLSRTLFALITFALCASASAKSKIDGDWEGSINVNNGKFPFVFHISLADQSTVDSPSQSLHGALVTVTLNGKNVHFSMPGAVAEFDGTLEKSQITGVFKQSKESWPLTLTKVSKKKSGGS